MANNYTQFSFQIDKLNKREMAWLKKALVTTTVFPKKLLNIADDNEWPQFDHELSPMDKTLWLYSNECGNSWNAAILIYAFILKFRPKMICVFSSAYTCSKPRLDEFGGETLVVNKDGIFSDCWLSPMINHILEHGKQQTRILNGCIKLTVKKVKEKKTKV